MPHIVKFSERRQCIRLSSDTWEEDLKYKYVRPVAEQAVHVLKVPDIYLDIIKALPARYSDYTTSDKSTLFKLIEQIVEDTVPLANSEFFNEFVDIKEVPYGRYNSDSDYRGS